MNWTVNMTNILICTNTERDPGMSVTKLIIQKLRNLGAAAKAFIPFGNKDLNGIDGDMIANDPEAAMKTAELLICLGGDGTMLHISKLAAETKCPCSASIWGSSAS